MQPSRWMTEPFGLRPGLSPNRGLNRAALVIGELVEVKGNGVLKDLPRRARFGGRYCLQPGSHGGPDRHQQLRIVADALRFALLPGSLGRASHPFFGFFTHRLDYITNYLLIVI